MSMPGYISKDRVEAVRLAECSVWTNPDGPGPSMSAETNVEVAPPSPVDPVAAGMLSYAATVGVSVQLVDDAGAAPRARVSAKLAGVVSVPADSEDPARAAMVSAVASMYPQAQAHLAVLAAAAQLGTLPTPVIDPEELVRAVEALEGAAVR